MLESSTFTKKESTPSASVLSTHRVRLLRQKKYIYILGFHVPIITVHGAQPQEKECTQESVYSDPGASVMDVEDANLVPLVVGGSNRSCKEILKWRPNSPSGMYTINNSDINGGRPLTVYCDMTTDAALDGGGGYTYYKIDQGPPASGIRDEDGCKQLGLQIAIWRSAAQVNWLLTNQEYPLGLNYLKVAGGIVGTPNAPGADLTDRTMNYEDPFVNPRLFRAFDEGKWFLRETGDTTNDAQFAQYQDGCYLNIYGFNPVRFNANLCKASTGTSYVCSTNDKGGPGVFRVGNTQYASAPPAANLSIFPPMGIPGDYQLEYMAMDSAGHRADPKTRKIRVRDSTPPAIKLMGQKRIMRPISANDFATGNTSALSAAALASLVAEPGAMCTDSCDELLRGTGGGSTRGIVKRWLTQPFDPIGTPGKYTRQYSCVDRSGNEGVMIRHFYFVPPNSPRVEMIGDDPVIIEAEPHARYVDPGARCYDANNVQINDRILVDGRVVNMGKPGTYKVFYACTDHQGRAAPSIFREVIVRDTTCPQITLVGPALEVVEAGFQFKDRGATALDNMDGDLSNSIRVVGDTVDTRKAFMSRGSCLQILQDARAMNVTVGSGEYFITITERGNRATGKSRQLQVWCDMETDGGGYTTYPIQKGLRSYRYTDDDSCAALGLQMVVPRTAEHFQAMVRLYGTQFFGVVPGIYGKQATSFSHASMSYQDSAVFDKWVAVDGGSWFLRDTPFKQPSGDYTPGCWLAMYGWTYGDYRFDDVNCSASSDTYICSTNDKGGDGTKPRNNIAVHAYHEGAETGVYRFEYRVQDRSGNRECAPATRRTVVVKDTLSPVIRVKLGHRFVIDSPLKGPDGEDLPSVVVTQGLSATASEGHGRRRLMQPQELLQPPREGGAPEGHIRRNDRSKVEQVRTESESQLFNFDLHQDGTLATSLTFTSFGFVYLALGCGCSLVLVVLVHKMAPKQRGTRLTHSFGLKV